MLSFVAVESIMMEISQQLPTLDRSPNNIFWNVCAKKLASIQPPSPTQKHMEQVQRQAIKQKQLL